MSTPPAPARVFGFVAAEADVCVLLRRGPSRQTLMVRWDLATDEFEIGQWLRARVYENLADVSPDGRLFVYQALNPKWGTERGGAYSVVCRPPYFTALAFWAHGTSHPAFRWRRSAFAWAAPKPTKGTLPKRYERALTKGGHRAPGWTEPEDGGLLVRETPFGLLEWRGALYSPRRRYRLAGEPLEVQWADVDRQGRLLFARAGRVYVRDAQVERELIDLNPYEFRPVAPPDWATRWP